MLFLHLCSCSICTIFLNSWGSLSNQRKITKYLSTKQNLFLLNNIIIKYMNSIPAVKSKIKIPFYRKLRVDYLFSKNIKLPNNWSICHLIPQTQEAHIKSSTPELHNYLTRFDWKISYKIRFRIKFTNSKVKFKLSFNQTRMIYFWIWTDAAKEKMNIHKRLLTTLQLTSLNLLDCGISQIQQQQFGRILMKYGFFTDFTNFMQITKYYRKSYVFPLIMANI